ncbi:elongation factor P maturation arginine rhamnosyltransferase EarP [Ramlibacter sp.]|uniref:elongation factor P maturation arginine rhamnosyltransferase EarP n=1 Tax=Ramlibacter sp. TaxID=1917967 RepID=UPI002613BB04|nr:elongation factor P maturation arginine rhamnosyltransferase EarP [Ramlibacter sp.]MDB5955770.1 hypothetical protein [Ramlibacter sp.]
MHWDLFCKVIDNHGDAGVCWRVAAELAGRGEPVRLWIDEPAMLRWMAPQGAANVQVIAWQEPLPDAVPGQVVIEAFGCDPPPAFVARMAAAKRPPVWLNLEYLSAESFVERNHRLPSPVMHGPGAGLVKHFFYPGFTPRTGGLLRERDFTERRARFDRAAWLRARGIAPAAGDRIISLFCYEPALLPQLLEDLAAGPDATHLLVTAGRATRFLQGLGVQDAGRLRLHFLPWLTQREYDELLWSCDLNFVRGEDSLARGLLASVPAVWQIYPQDDAAHHDKLDAFLRWLQPPPDLRDFFLKWNGVATGRLPPLDLAGWAPTAHVAGQKAHALPELGAELVRFAVAQ